MLTLVYNPIGPLLPPPQAALEEAYRKELSTRYGVVFTRLYEGHGILVRDVSAAPELAECLRISVGTPEDMEAVAAALKGILGG